MPTRLKRLIYTSRAGADAVTLLALAPLISEARAYNARHDVTGALAVHDGLFLQVLEGPRHAVQPLFDRIAADDRHSDLQITSRGVVSGRAFNWGMMGPLTGPRAAVLVSGARLGTLRPREIVRGLVDLSVAASGERFLATKA